MNKGSSAFITSHGQSSSTFASSSCTQKSLPSVHPNELRWLPYSSVASVLRWKTSTVRTLWHSGIFNAWSTLLFNGIHLPPRLPKSLVTTRLESQSEIRPATLFGLNPPKITECIAPRRAHASKTTHTSATIGMYTVTRSPFFIPWFFKTLANRFTWDNSWP